MAPQLTFPPGKFGAGASYPCKPLHGESAQLQNREAELPVIIPENLTGFKLPARTPHQQKSGQVIN